MNAGVPGLKRNRLDQTTRQTELKKQDSGSKSLKSWRRDCVAESTALSERTREEMTEVPDKEWVQDVPPRDPAALLRAIAHSALSSIQGGGGEASREREQEWTGFNRDT